MILTRRKFKLLLSNIVLLGLNQFVSSAAEETSATVQIRGDDSTRALLLPAEADRLVIQVDHSQDASILAEKTPPGRAIPVFLIIAGVIAFVKILELIQELYRKTYYGGVIIDMRKTPPLITNDLKIPAGMVFVIGTDGSTVKYDGPDVTPSDLRNILVHK